MTLCWALAACSFGEDRIELPPLELTPLSMGAFNFRCESLDDTSCAAGSFLTCRREGEFLEIVEDDCGARGLVCDAQDGCVVCIPGTRRCHPCDGDEADCDPHRIEVCNAEGDGFDEAEACALADGDVCDNGVCANACEISERDRSYVGCEFYAVDLDNAAIDDLNNAAAQQYAVAVANPHPIPITVRVELNEAEVGAEPQVKRVDEREVPPNFLMVFELPQREVDGSTPGGLNDGSHTALTSNAYRFVASHPVTLYQFNPLDNVDVFSNDASLLLPTSALGRAYTVVAWPQTIGNSEDPDLDFDSTSSAEDLRSFLTIVGTTESTDVEVLLGEKVVRVEGGGPFSVSGPNDRLRARLGPFDVLNLETANTNADFTGSLVSASAPVAIFVGSEASDVPLFKDYATRQCCADHLEEQLFPDNTLGSNFIITHMPPRTQALAAASDSGDLGIAQAVEPERVRLVSVREGETRVRTTLSPPDDEFVLNQRQDRILVVDQDFRISSEGPIAVLQALPSQGVTGIPKDYPGGDPAIIMVPPVEQYRQEYIFLTPDKYAFDFITVAAPLGASVRLDGELLDGREGCSRERLMVERSDDSRPGPVTSSAPEAPPSALQPADVYRCQLSFPKVTRAPSAQVLAGRQNDGVHRLRADRPVGLVVYGFDSFVSYAYAGGLDLEPLF